MLRPRPRVPHSRRFENSFGLRQRALWPRAAPPGRGKPACLLGGKHTHRSAAHTPQPPRVGVHPPQQSRFCAPRAPVQPRIPPRTWCSAASASGSGRTRSALNSRRYASSAAAAARRHSASATPCGRRGEGGARQAPRPQGGAQGAVPRGAPAQRRPPPLPPPLRHPPQGARRVMFPSILPRCCAGPRPPCPHSRPSQPHVLAPDPSDAPAKQLRWSARPPR